MKEGREGGRRHLSKEEEEERGTEITMEEHRKLPFPPPFLQPETSMLQARAARERKRERESES